MDRGASGATVHGTAESDTTEHAYTTRNHMQHVTHTLCLSSKSQNVWVVLRIPETGI